MRVLMLGKGWFPTQLGGLDRYYRELLEHLPEAHGIVIGPAEDVASSVTAVSEHAAPMPLRLVAYARAARSAGRGADLVDAHFALYALLPLIGVPLRSKPLVVHFQGPWADENVSAGDVSWWRHTLRQRLERAVYARADVAVTLTGAFRRILVERYGVSPWNTKVLAPGVDLARFSVGDRSEARSRFGLAPNAFVVCCARRLVPRMGLDVLIEAWATEFGSETGAQLIIAGDGASRHDLEQSVDDRSLAASVRLLGRVTEEDLLALYRAADVNVVPSVSFEGFGLVVLEAAACGTPSIVTREGGLPEAVAGLGDDLVVPSSSVDALAQRLARASQGALPSRSQTRTWVEAFGWEQVARSHRELFVRVVSGRTERPRRLRVVYVNDGVDLAGSEFALLGRLAALSDGDTDLQAHVILAQDGPLADRLIQAGISVEVLPMRGSLRRFWKGTDRPRRRPLLAWCDTLGYAIRLALRLRRLRPDVVHASSLKSGMYGAVAARLARAPLVWSHRDPIEPSRVPVVGKAMVRMIVPRLARVVICDSEATKRMLPPNTHGVVIDSLSDLTHAPEEAHDLDSGAVVEQVMAAYELASSR